MGYKFLFESAVQLMFKFRPDPWILINDIGILDENLRNGWSSVDFLGFLTKDKVLLIQKKRRWRGGFYGWRIQYNGLQHGVQR